MGKSIARLLQREPQPQRQPQPQAQPQRLPNLSDLPEDFITDILSFTTPHDVCRMAAVSRLFRSAANSDFVWNKWIPPQILSNAVAFSSKKELYLRLCDSILIDEGRKMIWLERPTLKIGYMLSARELNVVWGENNSFWSWRSRNDSRFSQCAILKSVCWLEVRGQIEYSLLSANTEYRVVFVLKLKSSQYGLSEAPIKFSFTTPFGEVIERSRLLVEERPAEESDDYEQTSQLSEEDGESLVERPAEESDHYEQTSPILIYGYDSVYTLSEGDHYEQTSPEENGESSEEGDSVYTLSESDHYEQTSQLPDDFVYTSEEDDGESSEEGDDLATFRYEEGDDYDDRGWLQLVVGKFTVRGDGDYDHSSAHIEFCMKGVNVWQWKRGLILDGVRIEPIIL